MHVVWLNKTWRWKDGDNTAQKMEFALKISFLNWTFYTYYKNSSRISLPVSVKQLHVFFISNARLKLAKNQVNTKQHPEAELLAHSSSKLFTKDNRTYSKK